MPISTGAQVRPVSRSGARTDNQELAHAAANEITCVITLASCGRDEFYEPGAFGRNAKEDIGAEQDLDDAEGCGVCVPLAVLV
jgi:hypothetical protein